MSLVREKAGALILVKRILSQQRPTKAENTLESVCSEFVQRTLARRHCRCRRRHRRRQ